MKIVCLIKKLPPTIYFVNTIHRAHPVSLVIEERPPEQSQGFKAVQKLIQFTETYGVIEALATIAGMGFSRTDAYRHHAINDHYFQDAWHEFQSDIPVLQVEDINAPQVLDRLRQEQPDIILDHGTSIVHNRILETAELSLNLHWGLSPYYRGTHCTEWALINWDPYNIGVTIHKLVKKIDGGDIIAQQRATVTPDDTAYSIDMQLSYMGAGLVCDILDRVKKGNSLYFTGQQSSVGYLTLDRQWSRYCRKQIHHIEGNRILEEMLRYPSRRQQLPIIESGENPDTRQKTGMHGE